MEIENFNLKADFLEIPTFGLLKPKLSSRNFSISFECHH